MNKTLNAGDSYTIQPGYYSGGTITAETEELDNLQKEKDELEKKLAELTNGDGFEILKEEKSMSINSLKKISYSIPTDFENKYSSLIGFCYSAGAYNMTINRLNFVNSDVKILCQGSNKQEQSESWVVDTLFCVFSWNPDLKTKTIKFDVQGVYSYILFGIKK